MEIPEFLNREKEIKELRAILNGRPNFLYFVYGPINSGKTALLMKIAEELGKTSSKYVVFYINFRGRDVEKIEDLMRVLFRVRIGENLKETEKFVKELLKEGGKVLCKLMGIPVPEEVFDILFRRKDKVEDVFAYLEEYFGKIADEGYRPIFILDEMQTIKKVINVTGRSIIERLFNFMVRLTKETHLCHCLCATSDCLFIEDVYSNARLEGRAKYLLVDDLKKAEALRVYKEFGFRNKELVWDYIGGKIGDMVSLFEEKKRGYEEETALKRMLEDEIARIKWIKFKILSKREDKKEVWDFLSKFKEKETFSEWKEEEFSRLLFWIEQNILFYNPMEGTIRPQSRLLWRAINEII